MRWFFLTVGRFEVKTVIEDLALELEFHWLLVSREVCTRLKRLFRTYRNSYSMSAASNACQQLVKHARVQRGLH